MVWGTSRRWANLVFSSSKVNRSTQSPRCLLIKNSHGLTFMVQCSTRPWTLCIAEKSPRKWKRALLSWPAPWLRLGRTEICHCVCLVNMEGKNDQLILYLLLIRIWAKVNPFDLQWGGGGAWHFIIKICVYLLYSSINPATRGTSPQIRKCGKGSGITICNISLLRMALKMIELYFVHYTFTIRLISLRGLEGRQGIVHRPLCIRI